MEPIEYALPEGVVDTRDDAVVGVLIVDDHRVFTEGLARLLADEPDIVVLGIAHDGQEALTRTADLSPRVILIDYEMPDQDGISVAERIKRSWPDTMVVMLTGTADDRLLVRAIEAGCSGFLTKDRSAAEVVDAVRRAARGEALLSPG